MFDVEVLCLPAQPSVTVIAGETTARATSRRKIHSDFSLTITLSNLLGLVLVPRIEGQSSNTSVEIEAALDCRETWFGVGRA